MGESISPGTPLLCGGDPSPTPSRPHHLRADAGQQTRPAPPQHPAGCCGVTGAAGRGCGELMAPGQASPSPSLAHPTATPAASASRRRGVPEHRDSWGVQRRQRSAGRGEEGSRAWSRGCSASGRAPRLPCTSWGWLQTGPASFPCSLGQQRSGGLSVSSPEVLLPLIGPQVVRLLGCSARPSPEVKTCHWLPGLSLCSDAVPTLP